MRNVSESSPLWSRCVGQELSAMEYRVTYDDEFVNCCVLRFGDVDVSIFLAAIRPDGLEPSADDLVICEDRYWVKP